MCLGCVCVGGCACASVLRMYLWLCACVGSFVCVCVRLLCVRLCTSIVFRFMYVCCVCVSRCLFFCFTCVSIAVCTCPVLISADVCTSVASMCIPVSVCMYVYPTDVVWSASKVLESGKRSGIEY